MSEGGLSQLQRRLEGVVIWCRSELRWVRSLQWLVLANCVASAAAQHPVIEAEAAFELGGVVGGERRHMMVASSGYCIGNGWGRGSTDSATWEIEVAQPMRQAVLALRCSTTHRLPSGKGPRLMVASGLDGAAPKKAGHVVLKPSRLLEEFRTITVKLGRLAAGRHRIEVRLETPAEVWLDCLSVCPKKAIPREFNRKLVHENVSRGGHFHLLFSPHVSAATEKGAAKFFKKLERFYDFLRKRLGGEPRGKIVTCCISARRDAADGSAHASGTIFMFDEEGALANESGNMMHELTHCFQTESANNGPMPRWVREGEAYVTCMMGDKELFRRDPLAVHGDAYDDPKRIKAVALDPYGYNVVQLFGSPWELKGRHNYGIWNCVFHHLYIHDSEFLTRFHERVRRAMEDGALRAADLRDTVSLSGAYVGLLAGDDPWARRFLDDWGFYVNRDEVPIVGEIALDVSCAWRRPGNGAAAPWQAKHDRVLAKKGFGYRQDGAFSWRGGPDHQWVFGDRRYGAKPIRLSLKVPKKFRGDVVLRFECDGREHEVIAENRLVVTTRDPRLIVPVDEAMSADGKVEIAMRQTRAVNGALIGFTVHRARKLPGKPKLAIACAANVKKSDGNRPWTRGGDRVQAKRGFAYDVSAGFQWTDGKNRQWFYHDGRHGNLPLDVVLRVPKNHVGLLVIHPDAGRFQRFTVDHRRSYVARLAREVVIPLDEALTADGEVLLRVRRFAGGNAAIVGLEVY